MPAYKDEKRNTWYCQFWINDFTGKKKHIVKRGFKTRREAKEYEEKYRESNRVGEDFLCPLTPPYMPFGIRRFNSISKYAV